jgi:hypothetical protein
VVEGRVAVGLQDEQAAEIGAETHRLDVAVREITEVNRVGKKERVRRFEGVE